MKKGETLNIFEPNSDNAEWIPKEGDSIEWKSYGRRRTGKIKMINDDDYKSIKAMPDDNMTGMLVAIKKDNCKLL